MKKFVIALLFTLALPSAQAAVLEIRGGVGLSAADSDELENGVRSTTNNGVDLGEFETFNADIFFNLPVSPIGVGIRHEWLNQDASAGSTTVDLEATNLSLIADLRLIDTAIYLGPIIGVGIPTAKLDFNNGTTAFSDSVDAANPSYFGGVEAGVILGRFILGAEVGYQSIQFEKTDSSSGLNAEIDLSGVYGKAMVGLAFF